MFNLDEFRAGLYGMPFSCVEELPEMCFSCVYLCHEGSAGCFCDSPFYYFCAYSWPDKLTRTVPPCLNESGGQPRDKAS
jgi:hypothetical protein